MTSGCVRADGWLGSNSIPTPVVGSAMIVILRHRGATGFAYASRIAARNSPAVWKRSPGLLASAFAMTAL